MKHVNVVLLDATEMKVVMCLQCHTRQQKAALMDKKTAWIARPAAAVAATAMASTPILWLAVLLICDRHQEDSRAHSRHHNVLSQLCGVMQHQLMLCMVMWVAGLKEGGEVHCRYTPII